MDEAVARGLLRAARAAAAEAHCPYSGLAVGAAVLAHDGRVFIGCNVENASYGLSLCAERAAVAAAVAGGARRLAGAAVWSRAGVMVPCGACRQVLAEFAPFPPAVGGSADGGGAEPAGAETAAGFGVVLGDPDGQVEILSLWDLLPRPFLLRDRDLHASLDRDRYGPTPARRPGSAPTGG